MFKIKNVSVASSARTIKDRFLPRVGLVAFAVASAAITFSGSAAAQFFPNPAESYQSAAVGAPPSKKTRAEVAAETAAVGVRGDASADDRRPVIVSESLRTRQEVVLETRANRPTTTASSYALPIRNIPSSVTRAAVLAKVRTTGTTGAASAETLHAVD